MSIMNRLHQQLIAIMGSNITAKRKINKISNCFNWINKINIQLDIICGDIRYGKGRATRLREVCDLHHQKS